MHCSPPLHRSQPPWPRVRSTSWTGCARRACRSPTTSRSATPSRRRSCPGGRHPRRPLRQAGYPAGEAGRTAFRRHRPRQLQRDPLLHLSPRHPAGRQHHQRRRQQAERRAALQPHRGLRPGQPGEAGGPVASPVRGAPAPARPADQARRQRRPRPVTAGRGGQHRRPAGNQSGPPGSRSGPGRRQRTPADQPA